MHPAPQVPAPPTVLATQPELAGELALRWRRARRAALRTLAPELSADTPDAQLLASAWAADPEAAQRRVFDNSFTLGRGFCSTYRVDLTLGDLTALLPRLGAPCVAELARVEGAPAARSARSPCAECGPAACAVWREALQGLVSGLSTTVYTSRVHSGAADGRCADLLHLEAQSELRYAPIPPDLQPTLHRTLEKMGRIAPESRLEVLGLVEGVLHIRLHSPTSGCGLDQHHIARRLLERALPGLQVQDASPRAVLPPE